MIYCEAYEDGFGTYIPLFIEQGRQDVKLHMYHWNGRQWIPDEALFNDEEEMSRVWGKPNGSITEAQMVLLIMDIFEKFVWEEI